MNMERTTIDVPVIVVDYSGIDYATCDTHPGSANCYNDYKCRTEASRTNRRLRRQTRRTTGQRQAAVWRRMLRGEQITNYQRHHFAMRWAFEEMLGHPIPEGLTLSLVEHDADDTYVAFCGLGRPRLVNNRLDAYVLETQAENNARQERFA